MAPTSLGSVNVASSADHTLTINGATAGKAVVVIGGIAAAITVHADSVADGWLTDDYAANNMGCGAFRLPGANNPGGTITLRLTHNGPRAFSGVAFEDNITALVDSSGPVERADMQTPNSDLAAGDLAVAYFSMVSGSDQSSLDVTAYDSSFTELADSGYQAGGGNENTRTWAAYREAADLAGTVTATSTGAGGAFTCASGVLVYTVEEGEEPTPVDGSGAATGPQATGSGAGTETMAGSGTGSAPQATGSGSGTVAQDVTGSGAGTAPAPTGSGSGTGGVVLVTATGGGWRDLQAIWVEARREAEIEASTPPVACPNDGEPLVEGPGGILFCRFDGWRA